MIKLCVGLLYSIQLYLANGFHVAVRLFSDSSQMNAVSLHAVACQPRFMFHAGVDILSENKPLLSFSSRLTQDLFRRYTLQPHFEVISDLL